jgi:hypothetical protein
MRCKLSTPGSPEYILPVTPSISATPDPRTPPSPSPSPSSLYLRTPAVAQSSAKLSGGGGGKRIFPPQREHLFRHCSRWRDQQLAQWKAGGKATGWKAGRCRHVQISELISVEECNQAAMDFLAATEVGKFPPR